MPEEKIEYKGYAISIEQDDSPDSPREWDNLGTMVCFHDRHRLGDKHSFSVEECKELASELNCISLPLFLYDHSGLSMSTSKSYPYSDPWDAGQVGIIWVSRAKVLKEWKAKHWSKALEKKALDCLRQEVETYSQYLEGDVWRYSIQGPPKACSECGHEERELVDSLSGIFGYEYAVSEAKAAVDAHPAPKKETA